MDNDLIRVTGMVLSAMPIGEYDRRLVLLSAERGKITVFARGARRQQSQWQASTQPFAMGSFTLYPGRSAYTLRGTEIRSYFAELSRDIEAVSYGFYFLEMAGYYSRENLEGGPLLNLLYVTLKALLKASVPNPLIRLIYEIRVMVIAGEFPEVSECSYCGAALQEGGAFSPSRERFYCGECAGTAKGSYPLGRTAMYALSHITRAPLTHLYTFVIAPEIMEEIRVPFDIFKANHIDRSFQSLAVLETIVT